MRLNFDRFLRPRRADWVGEPPAARPPGGGAPITPTAVNAGGARPGVKRRNLRDAEPRSCLRLIEVLCLLARLDVGNDGSAPPPPASASAPPVTVAS